MVRNERDPQGTSISEQYGRPVTASDVEDLMYRERVPSGTIFKVMQAVRQALIWTRYSAVRPWAGDLEDGLSRQEDRRREDRKERERALENAEEPIPSQREPAGLGAAAVPPASPTVNTPEKTAAQIWADQVLDWQRRDAAARSQEAPVSLAAPVSRPSAPPADPEPATALSGPQEVPEAEDSLDAVFEEARALQLPEAAAVVPVSVPRDAPGEPAAPPRDVATGVPGTTPTPGMSEAATGLSEPQNAKVCVKCHENWPLEFFQRDNRAPDGRRARCKRCLSTSDEFRRSMVRLRKATVEAQSAMDTVQEALDGLSEAHKALEETDVPPEVSAKPQEPVRVVQEVLLPEMPDPVLRKPLREPTDDEIRDLQAQLDQLSGGNVKALPPADPEPEESEDAGQRRCSRCGKLKGVFGFYQRLDGRVRNVCIECEREATRVRRAAKKVQND